MTSMECAEYQAVRAALMAVETVDQGWRYDNYDDYD